MPPRRSTNTSPTKDARVAAPSPARSTRSTRSRAQEDNDGETTSLFKSAPKAPLSRKADHLVGLHDTSVNIAAAFNAAQSGTALPTSSDRSFLQPRSKKHPTSHNTQSPMEQLAPVARALSPAEPLSSVGRALSPAEPLSSVGRSLSPAEQLSSAARALSPVRFFLRSTEGDDEEGEYSGFSSFSHLDGSGEASYDYKQEEAFVRAAQHINGVGPSQRLGDQKKKRAKAANEDLPYRPAEDGEIYDSDDSGAGGEGIVTSGALGGRAETRGKRLERGEGYLGMGLGISSKSKRSRRDVNGIDYTEGDYNDDDNVFRYRSTTPLVTVEPPTVNNHRSPTPAKLLRAFSPRVDRVSPSPNSAARRRRRPSSLRVVVTNIVYGVALVLRLSIEFIRSVFSSLIIRPATPLFRNGRRDGWKWLGATFALIIALRIFHEHVFPAPSYHAAPLAPPASMDELVRRLTSVEHALSVFSTSSQKSVETNDDDRKMVSTVIGRVYNVESSVASGRQQLETAKEENQLDMQNLHDTVDQLKKEVKDLTARVAMHDGAVKTITTVDREVQSLKLRVGEIERDVRAALDDGRLRSALERILPSRMPVRMNERGTIDIDVAFWSELKKVFIGQGEVESTVRRMIGAGFKTPESAPWLATDHEQQLENWAEKLFNRKAGAGAIISKNAFISMLEQELASLRHDLESNRGRSQSKFNVTPSAVTIKTAKGEDVTSALQALIDAALLRYSKDVIAKPDYALFTAGGRVIPSITSNTLVLKASSRFGRLLRGEKDVEGRQPATALYPDNAVGSCWPFEGPSGQLGVLLARRVVVTDVTVEHAAKELALDMSTTPRDVEVWAMVEGEENRAKVADYLERVQQAESSIPPSPDYILLATFTYDPESPSHVQTFPVPSEVTELGIETGIVIFRIRSNWGGDFTCLYRVRVHGHVALGFDG